MYQIAHRSHTQHETKLLNQNSGSDISGLVNLAIKPGLTYTLLLLCVGWGLEYVLQWRGYDIRIWGRFVGLALGLGLAFPLLIRYYTGERFARRLAKEQLSQRSVQEIIVNPLQVYEVDIENSKEPCLAIQVEPDIAILLWGNWLIDDETYQLDGFSESSRSTFNRLADPYAFPSTEFAIGRSMVTGMVLSLQPQGTYHPPIKASFTLKNPESYKECEFLHIDLSKAGVEITPDHITEPDDKEGHKTSGIKGAALVTKDKATEESAPTKPSTKTLSKTAEENQDTYKKRNSGEYIASDAVEPITDSLPRPADDAS